MVAPAPTLDWPTLAATAGALLAVLALIWALQALGRTRLNRGSTGKRLQRCETIALDSRRRLHLLTCDGRRLIVQTGGPQDGAISWLPDPP